MCYNSCESSAGFSLSPQVDLKITEGCMGGRGMASLALEKNQCSVFKKQVSMEKSRCTDSLGGHGNKSGAWWGWDKLGWGQWRWQHAVRNSWGLDSRLFKVFVVKEDSGIAVQFSLNTGTWSSFQPIWEMARGEDIWVSEGEQHGVG